MTRGGGGQTTPPLPPKPPSTRWTDAQWAGIATTGRSLLVSAAAGSGKTAVLAERCAYLVCDAPQPCDVDELLVVTFTEAAAAEMKSRIEKALFERISRAHDNRLARQLALVDRANVSTLHGFCARLIRQHFHRLELDPAFAVIDADEAALLRTEIARELFEERYEGPQSQAFHALVDAYGDGDDQRLIKKVLQTHDLLASLVDPQAWLAASRKRIADAASRAGDFRKSALGAELYCEIEHGISAMRTSCASALAVVSDMTGFEKYVPVLQKCAAIIEDWSTQLSRHGIDAIAALVRGEIDLGRLPPISNALADKDVAKSLVDDVRKQIKEGPIREILSFTTEQWRAGLAAVVPHANVFLDLVESFGQRYARAKAAMRGVDFADLERLTLRALRDPASPPTELAPSSVARMLHKQFAHVLVDEYQDINELQDAILTLASQPRNMFCVGDVKQSIYRFRLAEPKLFLGRQREFREQQQRKDRDGDVIDLQANFRSRAPLLKAMNDVFSRLMTAETADITYDKTHALVPGADYPHNGERACFTGSPIELHLLPAKIDNDNDETIVVPDEKNEDDAQAAAVAEPDRTQREAMLIARLIHELMATRKVTERDKQTNQYVSRPIKYGDIVILLRSMKFKGDDYADIIRRSDIPVHSDSSTGYVESMEVNDVLSLLKVLDNRAQDIPLAAVLRSPIAGLPDAEDSLARIRLAYPARAIAFHQAVTRYAQDRKHDDELSAKLRDILERLDRWRQMAQRRPLAELIWDVYDSTGYLAFCAGLRDGEQRKANLIDLHDRARQFGSFQRQGLARFLAFLDQLRDESDLGQPPVVSEGDDVVRIMTIHHSKGLEFPVVFLPDLGKKINLQDCSGSILIDRHGHLGMEVVDDERQVRYPSLASTLVQSRLRKQSMAEELRVVYVAMTRAKEHLVCIGTCKPTAADTWDARWSNHVGPLPADEVVNATCMLEWLGPVAAATRISAGEPLQVITHTVDEVRAWPTPESMRPSEGERQQRLARLDSLDPKPPKDTTAAEIIARLTTPYPFERFTKIAAVEAATALTKKGQSAPIVAPSRSGDRTLEFTRTLELPRAVRTELKPSAADVGEATHLVIQHLDFTRRCDTDDLRAQIANLVDKRLITPAAAQSVDVDSICWLAGSAVGNLLRTHNNTTRRELPIYLALQPHELDPLAKSDDPQDRIMVRSRADALVQTPRGLEVVDYKTDRVDDRTLAARVDFYRPQMDLYRRAIKAVTAQGVAAVHLVFLHARRIVTL